MEDMLGLWFGFIGIIVGAVITFITEIIIRNKQMRFDVSIEIRDTLLQLNEQLTNIQAKILKLDEDFMTKDYSKQVMSFKELHYDLMNAYKIYRIHMGDLKAYELNSAIYHYYFEKARYDESKPLNENDYKSAFYAIRYATGLLINHTRFELIKINSIKKITKEDENYKTNEFLRYARFIINWLEENRDWIETFENEKDNRKPFYRACFTVYQRTFPFINEVKSYDKNLRVTINV